jgi:glycopeptide antibiotics resistance protein
MLNVNQKLIWKERKIDYVELSILIYIIIYITIIVIIRSHNIFLKYLNTEIVNCSETLYKSLLYCVFGKNWYIPYEKQTYPKCRPLINYWHMSHLFLYVILGFLMPNNKLALFNIGILWEVYECVMSRCHNIFDLIFNLSGILIGYFIRVIYTKIITKNNSINSKSTCKQISESVCMVENRPICSPPEYYILYLLSSKWVTLGSFILFTVVCMN